MSMRVYSAAEVHAALPWRTLAAAIETAFLVGDGIAPQRQVHTLEGGSSLLLMPAWSETALGVKIVTVMERAARHGAATVQASYLLLDRHTGAPQALIDGEALTLRRTAATSALAASRLMPADARSLLVVGAGRLAPWMARAHMALNPQLERVRIWARRSEAAAAVAATLRDEKIDAQPAPADLDIAVREAQLVCCATTASEPLVHGACLQPEAHLDLVGGFRPLMREADDAAIACAYIVVDTDAAITEAGDIAQPLARGVIERGHVRADLAALLRGQAKPAPGQPTLFKSVGSAVEDLAAARLVVTGR